MLDPRGYLQIPFLPNLGAWLAADKINNVNTVLPANGASVVNWFDISGAGSNQATQTTALNQPLFETNVANGQPMVKFDGAGDLMTLPPAPSQDNIFLGGGFIMLAFKPLGLGGGSQGRLYSQGGASNYLFLNTASGSTCKISFNRAFSSASGEWQTNGFDITFNQVNIVAIKYDNNSVLNDPIIYVNSKTAAAITEVVAPVGGALLTSTITLGNSTPGTRTLDGYLGEMILIKGDVTSDEIDKYFDYLAAKYGVTLV